MFEAIEDLEGEKSPGPDGFTIAFFQNCWVIIKHDLMRVVTNFAKSCTCVKNLNGTFLSIIPKKKGAEDVRDFRPISLLSPVYNIISKVLARG